MAKKPATVPDAWDDDWESAADKIEEEDAAEDEEGGAPLTKRERLARHREANKKIWQEAESPETFHYLEATTNVPLATGYQPQVKVLSRKPVLAKRSDPAAGMANMSLQDDDEDEDGNRKTKETQEERAAREKEALEAKRRAYEEAKKRIFGDDSSNSSGQGSGKGGDSRGRGRGRGRGAGNGRGIERPRSSGQTGGRELFDPSYAAKPGYTGQKREGTPQGKGGAGRGVEMQAVREPRGPDGRGRGFGFAGRGGRGD